jgi:hypothetical protein
VKLIIFLLLALLTGSAFAVGDTYASFIDREHTTISSITAKAQEKDKLLPVASSINGTALKITLPPQFTSGNGTSGGNTPIDTIPIYRSAPPDIDGGGNPPISLDIPGPTVGGDIPPSALPTDNDPPAPPTDSDPPVTDSPPNRH